MPQIKKNGSQVTVTKVLQKTSPEVSRLEQENFILRDTLAQIAGELKQIDSRLALGLYPTKREELTVLLNLIDGVHARFDREIKSLKNA